MSHTTSSNRQDSSSHRHRRRHHKHDHHEKPSSSISLPIVPSKSIGKTRSSNDALSEPLSLEFTFDRRGDPQVLTYGSIDTSKVPRYRIFGYGRVIGLDRGWRIVAGTGSERTVENVGIDASERNRGGLRRGFDHASGRRKAVVKGSMADGSATVEEFTDQRGYISLGGKRRRVALEGMGGHWHGGRDGDGDDDDGASLGTDVARQTSKTIGSDFEAETSSDDGDDDAADASKTDNEDAFTVFKNHPDNKKYIELLHRTDKNPQNLQAWLDLIEHQERYLLLSTALSQSTISSDDNDTGTVTLTKSQKRAATDMRISLYEKAIATMKDSLAKETLLLGLMREGAKIWDTDRVRREWKARLVRSGPKQSSFELWCEYLNFHQTNVVGFTYERCLEVYLEVLTVVMEEKTQDRDLHLVYLIARLTRFMFEAGFAERAIAIWQCLLEFNFLRPTGENGQMQNFEAFWESESLRIGEDGASGWRSGVEQEFPSRTDEPLPDLSLKSLFSDWATEEMQRSEKDVMPARTLDDTVEDDPFRVILFSDVREFVFEFENKRILVQAFLNFCQLPPLFDGVGTCRKWWTDPFLIDFTTNLSTGKLTDTTSLFAPADSPLHVWTTLDTVSKPILDLAMHALTLLVHNCPDDRLAEYVVALHVKQNPTNARRFAKASLKRRPNSLLLYNAYALVETRNGRLDAANTVLATALSMASSFGSDPYAHKMILWHSWLWSLVGQQQFDHALRLLTEVLPADATSDEMLQSISSDHKASSGQRLRAESYFRDQIANALSQKIPASAEFTDLFALFRYLHGDHDIDAAIDVYRSSLSASKVWSTLETCEHLHHLRARFAHFHAMSSRSGYRPMQLLPLFKESQTMFPDNSLFFNLHGLYLHRAGIMDRVRTVDPSESKSSTNAISFLQSISKEMSRPSYAGSTTHSIRQTFEKATALDSEARNSPAVWLTRLQWEIELLDDQPKFNRKQVKEIYLSALRSCPWHKDLYLRGLGNRSLARAFRDQDLKQIYQSLGERGIRIRHNIDEVLDDVNE